LEGCAEKTSRFYNMQGGWDKKFLQGTVSLCGIEV